MKKLTLLFLGTSLFISTSFADSLYSMPALELGFKWNSMESNGATSNKQSLAYQFGGSAVFGLIPLFGLRTGLFYSERTFKTNSVDGKITYAELPAQLVFKIEDYAGLYFGPSFGMHLGDECNGAGCTLSGVKTMVVPMTVGAQFKFLPNLGLNLFFENISGGVADGIKNSRGIGVNALIAFD